MQKKRTASPQSQQVRGIFIFQDGDEIHPKALELMKTLDCTILTDSEKRMMIKTSRSNLQFIKQCWLSNDSASTLSMDLKDCISQIIIGGRA